MHAPIYRPHPDEIRGQKSLEDWIPAFAGMTISDFSGGRHAYP